MGRSGVLICFPYSVFDQLLHLPGMIGHLVRDMARFWITMSCVWS
jgi:hypothetical protein